MVGREFPYYSPSLSMLMATDACAWDFGRQSQSDEPSVFVVKHLKVKEGMRERVNDDRGTLN